MNEVVEKLRALERRLADRKGPFALFALFLRDDAPNVWDLVVAADWIDKNQAVALSEIAKQVQRALAPDEIVLISRVVIIDTTNPELRSLTSTISVEHGLAELANRTFFGLSIEHAYVITAQLRRAA